MTAVGGALNRVELPGQTAIESHPKDVRVREASESVFQRVKETLSRAWDATVIGFTVASEKVSFIFFRVLEWIHPSLGPRIENVFLRISNAIQAIKDAWKQEKIRKEIDDLRSQNRDLQNKVHQLQGRSERFNEVRQALTQKNEFLDQRVETLLHQQANIVARENAVVQGRDVIEKRNRELEEKNKELTAQRDQDRQNVVDIQGRLAQVQQEVSDLRARLENNQTMNEILQRIGKVCSEKYCVGQKTELDDDLEKLLPILLKQIETAKENLQLAEKALPEHSTAEIAIQSFKRILDDVAALLNRIPQMFKLHANWQSLVDQLIRGTV